MIAWPRGPPPPRRGKQARCRHRGVAHRCRHHRIDGLVGDGAVAPFAGDHGVKHARARHHRPVGDRDRARGQRPAEVGRGVDSEDDVHAGQRPLVQHLLRATASLLSRLKHELDGTAQLAVGLQSLQNLAGAQQHGRVRVVAARVHAARVLALEGQVDVLVHREGVEVGAQGDHGRAAAERRHDPGDGEGVPVGDSQLIQARADGRGGLDLVEPGLRYPMQLPAHLYDPGGDLLRGLEEGLGATRGGQRRKQSEQGAAQRPGQHGGQGLATAAGAPRAGATQPTTTPDPDRAGAGCHVKHGTVGPRQDAAGPSARHMHAPRRASVGSRGCVDRGARGRARVSAACRQRPRARERRPQAALLPPRAEAEPRGADTARGWDAMGEGGTMRPPGSGARCRPRCRHAYLYGGEGRRRLVIESARRASCTGA
eukprot:scaffold198_cov352-Prasinococcus_capsulatus_cf.AAC.2